jgi:hypothetical protein
MRIGNSNFDTKYKMKDNTGIDVDIEIIYKEKDLGINFTSNLKFDEHIGRTVNKVISHIDIPELRGLTYEQRLRALNLPTLVYRRQRGDMIQVFKLIRKIDDFDYEKLFKLSVTNHEIRGHIYKLEKLRPLKAIRQNSFTYRVVNEWNLLPSEIVLSKNVNEFKSKLDKHWQWKRFKMDNIY